MALDLYTDNERLGLAAYWADDAATKLAAALNAGPVHGRRTRRRPTSRPRCACMAMSL